MCSPYSRTGCCKERGVLLSPQRFDQRLDVVECAKCGESKRYHDRTWVVFTYDGKIIVNIQQEDYFLYEDLLAFDKLCKSLGKLFMEFFEEFRAGKQYQIIYRLNALNLNIITEG